MLARALAHGRTHRRRLLALWPRRAENFSSRQGRAPNVRTPSGARGHSPTERTAGRSPVPLGATQWGSLTNGGTSLAEKFISRNQRGERTTCSHFVNHFDRRASLALRPRALGRTHQRREFALLMLVSVGGGGGGGGGGWGASCALFGAARKHQLI